MNKFPASMASMAAAVVAALAFSQPARAAESVWIEAEHLRGVRGYCWPMGKPEMKKTDGHWGLSGPGWAAEWNQGGESGFLSIATGADDDRAVATAELEVPVAGRYFLWVRYGDWREATERFQVRIEQAGRESWVARFGERAVVEEDEVMKLYWGWAFAWDSRPVDLAKGPAKLSLLTTTKDPNPRQVDVLVLTTDAAYRPRIKDRPASAAWAVLAGYRPSGPPADLEPFARNRSASGHAGQPAPALPPAWKLHTFRDKGFLYLWNVSHTNPQDSWLGDKPGRVKFPCNVNDKETWEAFVKKYGGKDDVPIFSDERIVPTFHGSGAAVFATDAKTGELLPGGRLFAQWLEANPARAWAMMMNYAGDTPIGPKGAEALAKYRDRYVGAIAGESLGYFYPDAKAMQQATAAANTRRQLVAAFTPPTLAANAAKYRTVYGKDLDANPYADVIACLSVGNIVFIPLCFDWGARTVGYESSAATSSILNMRWAFIRGAARQHAGLTATYRSCNFGDASTIFSNGSSFHSPQNILDNYYSVYSGAGMTWYKMDIWYQYMAGASMFYHEQGFDEFWRPGGTSAAGVQDVQLSPKGKLVDRFLRVTARDFDRGTPYTPVAFLVDYAHGWEPAPFWPNSFKNWHGQADKFLVGDHERMLEEYFWSAYYPIGPESEKPMTATNEVYLPGVFGDIFDVIFAYPDPAKWRTIDTYPVVVAAGDIELTEAEGKRLAKYVDDGGTLLVAAEHLTGPGAAALNLPGPRGQFAEAEGYTWLGDKTVHPSQRYRYQPISEPALATAPPAGSLGISCGAGILPASSDAGLQPAGRNAGKMPAPQASPSASCSWADPRPGAALWSHRVLAATPDGKAFCVGMDRGKGRLIYLSVPRGLGIDRRAVPALPRLLAHLTRGLMPVEVAGDVQWLVNRTDTGWAVTLLNPAGQLKPQQGIFPTDFRENRQVTIRSRAPFTTARDRLQPDDKLEPKDNTLRLEVPAGGVRIIELR
jgi:hypothetical protein